ncbi:MAG: trehalose-phosphatase [Acidimicrobiales bacterium]
MGAVSGPRGPWPPEPARAALMTDFDGTLAAIVADPQDAVPVPGAVAALGRLTGHLGRVAVVSGRPVRFLADRLSDLAGMVTLVGLYGLEWIDGGAVVSDPDAEVYRAAVAEAGARAAAGAPAGVTVEDKGLAVTIHARHAPAEHAWVEDFAAATAADLGLVSHVGKLSAELRAPVPVDKGTVVARLSDGMAAAGYVGDDRGDLPAFAALARLRAAGLSTLAVATTSDEAPPELLAAADLVVDGPAGVLRLFDDLAAP